jgi:hypothetical protein
MKYTIKKFMGDDCYSWAVFRVVDVKGMRSPICDPSVTPVINGLSQSEARYHRDRLEKIA